jgi:hypothetical protein
MQGQSEQGVLIGRRDIMQPFIRTLSRKQPSGDYRTAWQDE